MQKISIAGLLMLYGALAGAEPIPLIDTHAHFQSGPSPNFEASRQAALANMDRVRIAKSLLLPPPNTDSNKKSFYDIEELKFAAKADPDRFALIGGSSLNAMVHDIAPEDVTDSVRAKFRQRALDIIAQGAVAFGEIAVLHVSIPAMGPQHPYESVPADHPLLLLLADIAAELDVPIDLHCDLVPENMPLPDQLRANPANPSQLQANLPGLERLFSHNQKTRFVWAHVGFEPLLTRDIPVVRHMLQSHPNLYMSFRLNRGAPKPAATIDADGEIKPQWDDLIQEFSDRFVLGSDAFYQGGGIARGSSDTGLDNLRKLVDQLPPDVGNKIASGNAIRIYRLNAAATPR